MIGTTNPIERKTIREWRAYRRLTKADVARIMAVDIKTYMKMEDNPENISMIRAVKLAEIFQCEVHNIIFFEKKPNLKLDFVV